MILTLGKYVETPLQEIHKAKDANSSSSFFLLKITLYAKEVNRSNYANIV